jgi:predicted phosphodiesterase
MSVSRRLTQVFNNSPIINFNSDSRFIIFSDCHRGDNTWADDFSHNQQIFFHALKSYYEQEFVYIELGDGDELWENKSFRRIRQAQSHIFWIMRKFYLAGRFHLILGNHDMCKQDTSMLEKFYEERNRQEKLLFDGIEVNEGLILKNDKGKLFLVHGHQGEFWSDTVWWFSQFWVRNFWKKLQTFGVKYPATPARNYKRRLKQEKAITGWIKENDQLIIAGHTHRPSFPVENGLPYFNSGSCVHPRCITGLEIAGNQISLIKWSIEPDEFGKLAVVKTILVGPENLDMFL